MRNLKKFLKQKQFISLQHGVICNKYFVFNLNLITHKPQLIKSTIITKYKYKKEKN